MNFVERGVRPALLPFGLDLGRVVLFNHRVILELSELTYCSNWVCVAQ
jgi:hypothetical protein